MSAPISPSRPGGYAELGLAPVSLHIPTRSNLSPARLRAAVEAWERVGCGARGFQFRTLDLVPPEVASEAAGVYVALRERHQAVAPSYVDVASRRMQRWYGHLPYDDQPLAVATTCEFLAPLREVCADRCDPGAVLDEADDPSALIDPARTAHEVGLHDVWSSGAIDLCRSFASRRAYRHLLAYRDERLARQRPSATPAAVQHLLSPLGYALVHEFGHLVEGELSLLGPDAYEHVFAELSVAVLGLDSAPASAQWMRHLAHYPADRSHAPRDRARRRHVGPQVAAVLGRYATTNRSELFAEAFVASYAARDRETRRSLRSLRGALYDVGLGARP